MENTENRYDTKIKNLIENVKNVGAYLQEHAEEIVYKEPYLAKDGFNIWLHFNDWEFPTIEVTQEILVAKKR